jgi:hypothetical protein
MSEQIDRYMIWNASELRLRRRKHLRTSRQLLRRLCNHLIHDLLGRLDRVDHGSHTANEERPSLGADLRPLLELFLVRKNALGRKFLDLSLTVVVPVGRVNRDAREDGYRVRLTSRRCSHCGEREEDVQCRSG